MLGMLVGHSYFGRGRIVEITNNAEAIVKFDYIGMKIIQIEQIQVLPLNDQY